MSAITSYTRLLPEIPSEQATNQSSWRTRSWKLLKPQRELFMDLGKLVAAQGVGLIITGLLSDISSQGDFARNLNLHLTDTYYTTCQQAAQAFLVVGIFNTVLLLCTGGYFLKMNQEKCNENISSNMQAAIQHQVEEEMQKQLGRS
ncbi:hypothetical protein [Candidatus Rhabdochlamydia porcellionis]|jgi:hypothetical protein|uniref:Uncharacterized protein n=1 Tax=Candidatus Rhabdochlamydia porcellionis TaxID=225148 RepID=A0ABX8Z560_9BACT|nr:hypothetical protein [Candidatus Rhabdochlamydia porcellionis]QZA59433.1 hypothetical protein RHAB15C_0001321 [Candidatus Rhabdochlamydia porcellionis]